jgi:hypothetical protein
LIKITKLFDFAAQPQPFIIHKRIKNIVRQEYKFSSKKKIFIYIGILSGFGKQTKFFKSLFLAFLIKK